MLKGRNLEIMETKMLKKKKNSLSEEKKERVKKKNINKGEKGGNKRYEVK